MKRTGNAPVLFFITQSWFSFLFHGKMLQCKKITHNYSPRGYFRVLPFYLPGGNMLSTCMISSAFSEGKPIPPKFTCKGLNFSPPLAWFNIPGDAKCLALVCEDPDAPGGIFVHWVLYNIPVFLKELPEGVPQTQQVPGIGTHGINDFQHAGYDGPCPPPGKPHHYLFTLFALNLVTSLPQGWRSNQLQSRIKPHTIAACQLMGTFQQN